MTYAEAEKRRRRGGPVAAAPALAFSSASGRRLTTTWPSIRLRMRGLPRLQRRWPLCLLPFLCRQKKSALTRRAAGGFWLPSRPCSSRHLWLVLIASQTIIFFDRITYYVPVRNLCSNCYLILSMEMEPMLR